MNRKIITILILAMSIGGLYAEECCNGGCWSDGCCPPMPKCHPGVAAPVVEGELQKYNLSGVGENAVATKKNAENQCEGAREVPVPYSPRAGIHGSLQIHVAEVFF